jgi:hypothetical protein
MPLTNKTSPCRRNMRHSQDDESHDIHNELKHKIRSSWEMHPCIVHHDILVPSRKQSRRGSDYTCETEPETEPENDLSDSERSLVCQEHREIYQSIHVRRHHHHPLKPSEGNVDILPMPFSDESVGDVIESEASSTACSEQLEEERDSSQVCASVSNSSFTWFRINYVLVMSAIMLADGLQGRCQKSVQGGFSLILLKVLRRIFRYLTLCLRLSYHRNTSLCPI